ncbi:MAG: DUF4389 domain-containing protein, partial [Gaiellaceae bacterium]
EQPAAPPPAPAPAAGPPATIDGPPTDYPIDVNEDYPEKIANWRPLVQWWLLVIPSFIAYYFVLIAAFFAIIAAWFAVTITGRWPEGLFNFIAGAGRWGARLEAYYYLTTESYPPFSLGEEPGYPVRTRFDYPEAGIDRWRPTLQWIMAIPHFIVLYVLGAVALICAIVAGFAILFTGGYPRGLFDIVLGYIRWRNRVFGYAWFLTERYPPFTLSS